ncbi:MAG: hypothetical protein ACTSYY_04375 [Promethearchaeota archaeon]
MSEFTLSVKNKSMITLPYESILGVALWNRILYSRKLKKAQVDLYENKIIFEGKRTLNAGDVHINIKRQDYRGSVVNFKSINLIGLIIGAIFFLLGIFGILVYAIPLFENDDSMPLGIGIIFSLLGLLIIILSILRKTTLSIRFVDPSSNSVRYIYLTVRKDAHGFYTLCQEFLEKLWPD